MNIRNHFPTEELQKRDAAHHLHPFSAQADLAKKGSKVITSAQGVYVFDSNEIGQQGKHPNWLKMHKPYVPVKH